MMLRFVLSVAVLITSPVNVKSPRAAVMSDVQAIVPLESCHVAVLSAPVSAITNRVIWFPAVPL